MLKISALGPLKVFLDGQLVDHATWRRQSARQLLQFLLSRKQFRASREEILDQLWPDSNMDAVANRLYIALHGLRSVLEPARTARSKPRFILSTNSYIEIASQEDDIEIDIARFESLSGAPETSEDYLSCLEKAVALYNGALFADTVGESYFIHRRQELQQKYARAVVTLANHWIKVGDLTHAEKLLPDLIGHDATNEEAYRLMMKICASKGSRVEALRYYDILSRNLAERLGVKPDQVTQSMAQKLRQANLEEFQGDPDHPATIPLVPEGSVHKMSTDGMPVLLGRDNELRKIIDLILNRQHKLLCIHGLNGVGKSALALVAAQEAQKRFANGAMHINLAGIESETELLSTMAQLFEISEGTGPNLAALIANKLAESELLIVADNLESGLVSTALSRLMEHSPTTKLLVTARTPTHLSKGRCHNFLLAPLAVPTSEAELSTDTLLQNPAVALLAKHVEEADPTVSMDAANLKTLATIARELDGIPLALEIAAHAAQFMSIDELAARVSGDANLSLPAKGYERGWSLQSVVQSTCEQLSDTARAALPLLSVFSETFSLEAADSVLHDTGDVIQIFAELTATGLMHRYHHVRGLGNYELIRSARRFGLKELELQVNVAHHARHQHARFMLRVLQHVAEELESRTPSAAMVRGHAIFKDAKAALDWAVNAREVDLTASLCRALSQYWCVAGFAKEGFSYLQRAAALLNEAADEVSETHQHHIAFALGQMCYAQSMTIQAIKYFKQAEETCLRLNEKTTAARCAYYLGHLLMRVGQLNEAGGCFERLEKLSSEADDQGGLLAAASIGMGAHSFANRQLIQARQWLDRGVEMARWQAPIALLIEGLVHGAQTSFALGDLQTAQREIHEAYSLANSLEAASILPMVLLNYGHIKLRLGLWTEARDFYEQARLRSFRYGDQKHLAGSFLGLALCCAMEEKIEQAIPLIEQSLMLAKEDVTLRIRLEALRVGAMLNAALGRYQRTRVLLGEIQHHWTHIDPLVQPQFADSILAIGVRLGLPQFVRGMTTSLWSRSGNDAMHMAEDRLLNIVVGDNLEKDNGIKDTEPTSETVMARDWQEQIADLMHSLASGLESIMQGRHPAGPRNKNLSYM